MATPTDGIGTGIFDRQIPILQFVIANVEQGCRRLRNGVKIDERPAANGTGIKHNQRSSE